MQSGWFYEGGGIYRKTWLHSAPPVHLETDGVFAHGHVTTNAVQHRATPALGASATSAEIIASAEVIFISQSKLHALSFLIPNDYTDFLSAQVVNTGSAAAKTTLEFTLFDADGQAVGAPVSSGPVSLTGATNSSTPATAASPIVKISLSSPELWSVARPYLYTLQVTTDSGDAKNTSIGIYATKWTGEQGFFLNDQHVKIRGFCNHESFGGVGMAIPDRVNLYRAQGMRSVGLTIIIVTRKTQSKFLRTTRAVFICH